MSIIGQILMLLGGVIAVIAGIGMFKFDTPYARFHSGGMASPIAFVIAAVGASLIVGLSGAAYLIIAIVAALLTMPIAVYFLFRAVHRTTDSEHLVLDELKQAQGR